MLCGLFGTLTNISQAQTLLQDHVLAWGSDPLVEPGTRFKAIAAGGDHNLALTAEGTVVGWGDAFQGEGIPAGLSNVIAVSARTAHSLALKRDGTVVDWGWGGSGRAAVVV